MMATALRERLIAEFRWVGDRGTRSRLADTSGWYRDPSILSEVGSALAAEFREDPPDLVIAPERSGYLIGPLVAQALGAGFVGVEKSRHDLADSDIWLTTTTPVDYLGRNMQLHVRKRLLPPGARVLIVDDWADTGGQLLALSAMAAQAGAKVAGVVVLVDALAQHTVRRSLGLRSLLNVRDLRD
jgi:adenine phosphoribosyltransferase